MKAFLFVLTLCSSSITFAQFTSIPDANFEAVLITMGLDVLPIDGQVPTANIDTLRQLDVSGKSISDLTGIEDFIALKDLDCGANNLTHLDLSNNGDLTRLWSLYNPFTCINIKNGNNLYMQLFHSFQCPNLVCIEVDDAVFSNANWTTSNYIFDASGLFSDFCSECNVSLNELNEGNFSIYPNPVRSSFSIDGLSGSYGIALFNTQGQLLYQNDNFSSDQRVHLADFDAGVLLVRIDVEGTVYFRKVIKE